MSKEYSRAWGEELEILLALNEQLREEVRAHGKRKSRRYLGSLTALGVIVGYIFATNGDGRVLVLIPYVLAFLYLSQISSMNYVAQLAALLALIEAKINSPGAEYEFYHGGFNISKNPRFEAIEDFENDSKTSRTYIARLRNRIQKRTLSGIDGSDGDPEVLQHTVQARVRDGMHILAVIAYWGAAILGICIVLLGGIPELGISGVSIPESLISIPELSTLIDAIIEPITFIGFLLFGSHLYVFYYIAVAWAAYKQHTRVLKENVKKILDKDDFDDGLRDLNSSWKSD